PRHRPFFDSRNPAAAGSPSPARRHGTLTSSASPQTPRTRDDPPHQLLFFQKLLHHIDGQFFLRHQPLEPRVLLLQLPQPLHIRLVHRSILMLPRIISRLAHAMLATQLLNSFGSNLAFTQDGHNLFLAKSFLHHSPFRAAILYYRVGTFSGDRTED